MQLVMSRGYTFSFKLVHNKVSFDKIRLLSFRSHNLNKLYEILYVLLTP